MSAHGRGLALDIAGFGFADGRRFRVADHAGLEPAMALFLRGLRRAACGSFLTVLGPGSDSFHEDHLHLDLEQHGSGTRYRICE